MLHIVRNYSLLILALVTLSSCTSMQNVAQNFLDDVHTGSTYGFPKKDAAYSGETYRKNSVKASWEGSKYGADPSVQVYDFEPAPEQKHEYYEPYSEKTSTGKNWWQRQVDALSEWSSKADIDEVATSSQPEIQPVPVYDDYKTKVTGRVLSHDSSVTVYSLDGDYGDVGQAYSHSIPALTPPSSARPSYQSPPVFTQPAVRQLGSRPMTYHFTQPEVQQAYNEAALIYFGHGSAVVTKAGKQVVDYVVTEQKDYPASILRVGGHASTRAGGLNSTERSLANLKISMSRALNVSKELVRSGVPVSSIVTTAYGDTQPSVSTGKDISNEAASRRVEIIRSENQY